MTDPAYSGSEQRRRRLPIALDRLFSEQPALRQFQQRVKQSTCTVSDELKATVAATLPPHLVSHTHVTGLNRQTLSLVIDDPALMTDLRFMQDSLITALKGLAIVTKITVQIETSANQTKPMTTKRPKNLPSGTGTVLRRAAATIKHPELAAALSRLANRDKTN